MAGASPISKIREGPEHAEHNGEKNPTSVGSAIKEAGKDREKAVVVRPM
jgi:hypothetical protein